MAAGGTAGAAGVLKPMQGRAWWSDDSDHSIARVIKNGTKGKVKIVLPAWIAHNLPENFEIIAHYHFQFLVSVPFFPNIIRDYSGCFERKKKAAQASSRQIKCTIVAF